jgi:hypothetical protein
MTNRLNSLNPSSITEPKLKPVFYINADNVALTSGAVSIAYNIIENTPGELLPKVENILVQSLGSTYRPPLVLNGLNGRNYMNFADTLQRYLFSSVGSGAYFYAAGSPISVSGMGMTYMFVIKRKRGATYTILDGRDSSAIPTTNDILLEVDSSGRITFDYCGGVGGSVTNITGVAGVNLLNDWSILTVKCQLREDNGPLPSDSSGVAWKRYMNPIDARFGPRSVIDIFVNGVEQQKSLTVNTFTNADYYNDGSFRMFDRDIWIGNKGNTAATSGTHIAAVLMIPAYISRAYQQRLENYFRNYYSLRF